MIEDLTGANTFTHDPRRNLITEGQFSLDPNTKTNTQLPDHKTATILAESFFTNVCTSLDDEHSTKLNRLTAC
jgi:hypothetical protein